MLSYETARKLFAQIREKAALCHREGFDELYEDFLKAAVSYAETRLSWAFMDLAEKRADDGSRTIRHNGFMALLSPVCRCLDIREVETLMPDRKSKGDFACYITLFLALEQR